MRSHPHFDLLRESGFVDCADFIQFDKQLKIHSARWQGALNILNALPYGSTLRESVAHKLRLSERGQI